MITLPPYEKDRTLYHKLPSKDRWIFNKLEICERFDYKPYGPCGTPMSAGTYCVRPIINLLGMAEGGFFKKVVKEGGVIFIPSFMWTPWNTGTRTWVEYVDDEISSANVQVSWDENTQTERYMEQPKHNAHPLPDILKGISRYMLVEYLGDTVIDIGPRHLGEEPKESVIEDYKKFDPDYKLELYKDKIGQYPTHMKRVQNDNGSYSWEELDIFAPRKIYT
jgi:hypothetical protein